MIISAFAIHTGGGAALLKELVAAADAWDFVAILDSRFPEQLKHGRDHRVPPTLAHRLGALWRLSDRARGHDVLLCLNGLPPLRRASVRTIAYVHSMYMVSNPADVRYGGMLRLRVWIERMLFRIGLRNVDEIWVQTESVRRTLAGRVPGKAIRIAPFAPADLVAALVTPLPTVQRETDFFYPADPVPHKNHPRLLRAWALLGEIGERPPLVLTLTPAEFAGALGAAGLEESALPNVTAIGRIPRSEVLERLSRCRAMIFPSLTETFGLPLIEAERANAAIIASERDFVRDVCAPSETFDPLSPLSIARAVGRVLGRPDERPPLLDGAQFVARLRGKESAVGELDRGLPVAEGEHGKTTDPQD